jgi:hypothetical protein
VLAEYYLAGGMLTLFVVAPGVIGPAPEVIEYPRDEMMRFIQSAFGTGSGTEGAAPLCSTRPSSSRSSVLS